MSTGHPISFGKTLDRLLAGKKTVTRRRWSDSRALHFSMRYREGLPCVALDIPQRNGGGQVGWLDLTQEPYKEILGDMPYGDVAREGYPELTKTEFLRRFFDSNDLAQVWVVRFKFRPIAWTEMDTKTLPLLEMLKLKEQQVSGGWGCRQSQRVRERKLLKKSKKESLKSNGQECRIRC